MQEKALASVIVLIVPEVHNRDFYSLLIRFIYSFTAKPTLHA